MWEFPTGGVGTCRGRVARGFSGSLWGLGPAGPFIYSPQSCLYHGATAADGSSRACASRRARGGALLRPPHAHLGASAVGVAAARPSPTAGPRASRLVTRPRALSAIVFPTHTQHRAAATSHCRPRCRPAPRAPPGCLGVRPRAATSNARVTGRPALLSPPSAPLPPPLRPIPPRCHRPSPAPPPCTASLPSSLPPSALPHPSPASPHPLPASAARRTRDPTARAGCLAVGPARDGGGGGDGAE